VGSFFAFSFLPLCLLTVVEITHRHIRALALLYLRYTLPPVQLWEWFEPYLEDEEEVKVERGPPPRYM
jgi:hypothetical protein